MSAVPAKVRDLPGRPASRLQLFDRVFFGLGTAAAIWLAWALAAASLDRSWWGLLLVVVFWLVLAYVALPRLNRILTAIYVPDYFIGRTRTSDGLLGDPLNLAFRGTAEQLSTVMRRAGWTLSDPVDLASSARIVASTLTRRSYPTAPVSPLLLFGRPQDASYQQEVAGNPAQRHHVRFWRTPDRWLLPGGHRVEWLAGGTYDRRVGLSLFTLQVTHKIDADIDVERDFIVASITAAEPGATVEPLVDFTTGYHARNGGGDSVHTDGTLPVVDLRQVAAEPDAPDLLAGPTATMPATVLLPALLATLSSPITVVAAFVAMRSSTPTSERASEWVGAALAVAIAGLALLMLRRSGWARLCLLGLSLLEVGSRIATYHVATGQGARLLAIVHAASSILILVTLSGAAARSWCRPPVSEAIGLPGSFLLTGRAVHTVRRTPPPAARRTPA